MQQAETVRNTLQSARYLKSSLRQMDPRALANMMGQSLDQVRAMASMQDQLGGLITSEQSMYDRINRFKNGAHSQNMKPSEYLAALSRQSAAVGGVYKTSLDADQRQMADVHDRIRSIQDTAASVPEVTSQVQGLQRLLTQNTQVQTSLLSLNQAMTKANALAAMEGQRKADSNAALRAGQAQEASGMEKLKDVRIQLPDAGQYAPGDSSTH